MARQRLTRKEIKQPDQFITYTVQVLDWVKAHTMQILYGAVGIVAIIVIFFIWSAWQAKRLQRSEVLLYEASKVLESNDGQNQVAEKDRAAAVLKLQGLVESYPGTSAAAMAHWYLGHQYYARSDYASALTSYRQALSLIKDDEQRLIPALVTLNIAYAQEASGVCGQAIESYQHVLQSEVLWLHGEAFLGVGRCNETMGAMEQAQEVYARALSNDEVQGAVRQRLLERQTALTIRLGEVGPKTTNTSDSSEQDATGPPSSEAQK